VGNIGEPVLDALLSGQRYDVYVIELSSFQLERSAPLGARAATILNVSPDHMDRYADLLSYQQAKQAIYRACEVAVFNRDDKLTSPLLGVGQQSISFGSGPPDLNAYGLVTEGQAVYLARGSVGLLDCREMKIHGSHNQLNALAALALGEALGLPQDAMLAALREFPGVPHRCQWVAEHRGVRFFDDSKATNVGATLAALRGLSQRPGDVVLIAGGVGKGADFAPLLEGSEALKALVLLGEAAAQIAAVFQGRIEVVRVGGMAEAVKASAALATTGDIVLLAPACASFDMYADYAARGDDFARQVARHLGEVG
jgi:UDP-N-acetylmuramoylalanine--D-glutamate ligase